MTSGWPDATGGWLPGELVPNNRVQQKLSTCTMNLAFTRCRISSSSRERGFTLIEMMIAVAIVAILAAIAYPSYRDYIIRGRLTDGTNGLSAMQADMERYFQDNRTYANVTGPPAFTSPCNRAAATRTFRDFVVSCSAGPTANTYTLLATGSGPVGGFNFTIDQNRVQGTTTTVTGWMSAGTCWVVRRGQTCP